MARVREALIILRRLQQSPADKWALMKAVQSAIPSAYDLSNQEAQISRFERDLKNVRNWFEADIDWHRASGLYYLRSPNPYAKFAMSDEALSGLAFLMDAFDFEGQIRDLVKPLFETLQGVLTAQQAQDLERVGSTLHLKFKALEGTKINATVWQKVNYAIATRCVLKFDYIAPRHTNKEPRTHIVEPYDPIRFHKGHFELSAYCQKWRNPHGMEKTDAGWIRYRLDRIQSDGLEVLPEVLKLRQRQRRLTPIRYSISPRLARGGVSQYFEDMEVHQPDDQGWVTVTGKATDLFEAERIFLAYGQHCIVHEPPQLVQRMKQAVKGMAENYREDST